MKKILFILISIVAFTAWAGDEYTLSATYYYPGSSGAGSRTASGDRIDVGRLKNQEFRWVALSRDMYRAGFNINDTIEVTSATMPQLNGKWVVKDKMGGHRCIDFLIHRSNASWFRNAKVTVRKVK